MSGNGWTPVIGLEIHVQLLTGEKLFCGDPVTFGREPNTRVCPVCLGLPGALPVLNGRAVELAVRAAVGLGCRVHRRSVFARKQYFYPDLPKGYQITQYREPLAGGGELTAPGREGPVRVRMRRLHLEEDAGKSLHDRIAGHTAVDLNRAGVPLVEIVTEPDLRSPSDARSWLGELKRVLAYLEVSDCSMERGSLRVDANVSLARDPGAIAEGSRTEVKNMNSFSAVEAALTFEIRRQGRVLEGGGAPESGTRSWDESSGRTVPLRAKEASADYRYFDEPDLPPLVVSEEDVERIRDALPELPGPRRERLVRELGLPAYDAEVLTDRRELADWFEAVAEHAPDPKTASNWVMGPVLRALNETGATGPGELSVSPRALGELLVLVDRGRVSRSVGEEVFRKMLRTGRSADEIVEEEELEKVADRRRISTWVEEALSKHSSEAERLVEGEDKLVGFFMGRVMERSGGRADPGTVREMLEGRIRDR